MVAFLRGVEDWIKSELTKILKIED